MSTSYGNVPQPNEAQLGRGYGGGGVQDLAQKTTTIMPDTLIANSNMQHQEELDEEYGSSQMSTTVGGSGVSRNNTLRKKGSVRRTGSLRRSSSKRSLKAGSIKRFGDVGDTEDFNSAFFTPVPTTGTPTDVLADRFQAWRQLLKSLITYFREIQNSYDARAKAVHKVQNTLANMAHPSLFMRDNGLGEASQILEDYHKRSIAEANKSKEIENDVIGALTGLRSDLGQKIKEIKSLSGDFKNSVEKEKDTTMKEVEKLQDALQHADHEDGAATGKGDPYVVRLGVDRAIEKQIDEENYLHRAYLNLESSGRELESIVVGEIQKAYNALAGILKREGDDAYSAVESLRSGPIAMPKDQEWYHFVTHDQHFVDPSMPLRRIEDIDYPGKHHPSATEIRAGMLERKSKYLKSYTPGWYVLSPTHLHEFKSADKIYSQPPVMSLYLGDQKLGSRSEAGSSSHKFMLKGKQSGGMHKGHNWVFRAESFDTMMAWFGDIQTLTEKSGAERQTFIRKHARSVSGTSDRATISSDGLEEDEADQTPYSAVVADVSPEQPRPQRPQPGGRFPSDLALRTVGHPVDGADDSDEEDVDVVPAVVALPGSAQRDYAGRDPYHMRGISSGSTYMTNLPPAAEHANEQPPQVISTATPATIIAPAPVHTQTYSLPTQPEQPVNQQQQPFLGPEPTTAAPPPLAPAPMPSENEWIAPAAVAGVAGVGAGALGANAYSERQQEQKQPEPALEPTEPTPATPAAMNIVPVQTTQTTQVPPAAYSNNRIDEFMTNARATEPVAAGPSTTAADLARTPVDAVSSITAGPATSATADSAMSTSANTMSLGGNEKEGAHETGQIFPRVVRHDTNLSISQLHVPGEFPKRG